MKKFSLSKAERISLKKDFDKLFKKGNLLSLFPFKVYYLFTPGYPLVKISVSISTNLFKRAIQRNYIKRIIKEAYRKNKHLLLTNDLKHNILINFTYVNKHIISYHEMETYIKNILLEIKKAYSSLKKEENEIYK
ncbi:MAG: ribonuclease P protein component [Bacteroidales bacterium]|nr:ribonuclease P protein component [Bacteroidales bacterium]